MPTIRILGRVSESVCLGILGGEGSSSTHGVWVFVDYADEDILSPIPQFTLLKTPGKEVERCEVDVVRIAQQEGRNLDFFPAGWKTLAKLSATGDTQRRLENLPEIASWSLGEVVAELSFGDPDLHSA